MFNKGGNGEDYTAKGKFDVDLGDLRSSVTRRASTGRCPGQTTQNLVGGPSRRRADPLIRRGGLEKIKLGLKSRRGSAIALWRTKNTRCVDTPLGPRPSEGVAAKRILKCDIGSQYTLTTASHAIITEWEGGVLHNLRCLPSNVTMSVCTRLHATRDTAISHTITCHTGGPDPPFAQTQNPRGSTNM